MAWTTCFGFATCLGISDGCANGVLLKADKEYLNVSVSPAAAMVLSVPSMPD